MSLTVTVAIVGGARVAGHPHGTRWDPPERPLRCRPMVWDVTTGWGSRSPYPQPAYPGGILPETGEAIRQRSLDTASAGVGRQVELRAGVDDDGDTDERHRR